MSTTEETLKRLNEQTFDAEAKEDIEIDRGVKETWDQFLTHALAVNFTIRRANRNAPLENREQMIRTTAGRTPARRILSDIDVVVFEDREFGMVTCIAAMGGKKYHNIKLFSKQP